jgi:hypothetical protein
MDTLYTLYSAHIALLLTFPHLLNAKLDLFQHVQKSYRVHQIESLR